MMMKFLLLTSVSAFKVSDMSQSGCTDTVNHSDCNNGHECKKFNPLTAAQMVAMNIPEEASMNKCMCGDAKRNAQDVLELTACTGGDKCVAGHCQGKLCGPSEPHGACSAAGEVCMPQLGGGFQCQAPPAAGVGGSGKGNQDLSTAASVTATAAVSTPQVGGADVCSKNSCDKCGDITSCNAHNECQWDDKMCAAHVSDKVQRKGFKLCETDKSTLAESFHNDATDKQHQDLIDEMSELASKDSDSLVAIRSSLCKKSPAKACADINGKAGNELVKAVKGIFESKAIFENQACAKRNELENAMDNYVHDNIKAMLKKLHAECPKAPAAATATTRVGGNDNSKDTQE